jgi:hypothetical protein
MVDRSLKDLVGQPQGLGQEQLRTSHVQTTPSAKDERAHADLHSTPAPIDIDSQESSERPEAVVAAKFSPRDGTDTNVRLSAENGAPEAVDGLIICTQSSNQPSKLADYTDGSQQDVRDEGDQTVLTEEDRRYEAAVVELELHETHYCDIRRQFEEHQITYATQMRKYFKDNPPCDDGDVKQEEAFGPVYVDLGRVLSIELSAVEAALKTTRVIAREAGIDDVHFWDQESDFFSREGEVLSQRQHEFLLNTCPRKVVREWQWAAAKAQTSKCEVDEFHYALSGAHVRPSDSSSCRAESYKRRKIDADNATKKPWIHGGSDDGDDQFDEQDGMDVDDPTSPITPHKLGRKARASSDLARKKHFARKQVLNRSWSWGTCSDNVPDFEFSFIPPVLLRYSDIPRGKVSPKTWSSLSASLTADQCGDIQDAHLLFSTYGQVPMFAS